MSMKVLKIFKKLMFTLMVILFLGAVVWYSMSYLPYKSKLEESLSQSKVIYAGDLSEINKLAKAAETEKGIDYYLTKTAYYELSFKYNKSGGNIKWHLNQVLWYFSNKLLFTGEERFYLWLYYGHLNELANKHFGNPLMQLSFIQKAQIIGMVKSPSVCKPGTERGSLRTEWVLKQYYGSLRSGGLTFDQSSLLTFVALYFTFFI